VGGWPHPVQDGDTVRLKIGFDATQPDQAFAANNFWSDSPGAMWQLELGNYFKATSFPGTTVELLQVNGIAYLDVFLLTRFEGGPLYGWTDRDIRVRQIGGVLLPAFETLDASVLISGDYNASGPQLMNSFNWGYFSGQDFTATIDSISIVPAMTPVPEPTTYGIATLTLLAALIVRRSRTCATSRTLRKGQSGVCELLPR
jgi:hypothetical protein